MTNRNPALLFAALLLFTSHSSSAGGGEEPIEVLLSAPLQVEYVNDGAADATVTLEPVPEVRRIVDLRESSIPLLIDCLDDPRPTRAHRAALGYVCLDILTHVVDAPQILIEDCADDGLGACIREPYYFEPNASGKTVSAVKRRWETAHKEGKIKFVYPSWWH